VAKRLCDSADYPVAPAGDVFAIKYEIRGGFRMRLAGDEFQSHRTRPSRERNFGKLSASIWKRRNKLLGVVGVTFLCMILCPFFG
jgi:hypothetical protein